MSKTSIVRVRVREIVNSKDRVRVSTRVADCVSDLDFMLVNVSVNVLDSVRGPFVSDAVNVIDQSSVGVGVSVRGWFTWMVIVSVSVLERVSENVSEKV